MCRDNKPCILQIKDVHISMKRFIKFGGPFGQ